MISSRTILPAALLATLALTAAAGAGGGPPPSGTIAIAPGGRAIYLVSLPAGTTSTARAPDDILGAAAVLSPDGRRVAIAGDSGIWVLGRDGSDARRIAPRGGVGVAWSPDSRRLAFVRYGVLVTVSANGRNVHHLTARAEAPDWLADGRRIVFVRDPDQSSLNGAIYSIGANGHGLRRLVAGRWYAPHASPNGARLVFFRNGREGIYTAPAGGGKARLVRLRGTQPEWSPDGRYLAYTREISCGEAICSSRVFVAPARGGNARPVGPVIGDLGPFSWSR